MIFYLFTNCSQDVKNEILFQRVTIDSCYISNGFLSLKDSTSIVWKSTDGYGVHEFINLYFENAFYLGHFKIENPSEKILTIMVYADNKLVGKYKPTNNIYINKKIKKITILIRSVKGTLKIPNNNGQNIPYIIEFQKQNSISLNNIKLFGHGNIQINSISFNYKNKLKSKKYGYLENYSSKRYINYYYTDNNELAGKSISITKDKTFSAYKFISSKTNPQELLIFGTYSKLNKKASSIICNGQIFNLINGKHKKFSDIVTIKNRKIESESIFNFIFTDFQDDALINVSKLDSTIIIDMKYATKYNFFQTKLYDCPDCYLRYEIAKDIINVHKELKHYNLRVKLFDCYRPLSVQKILWKKMPVEGFVADPAYGSLHNKGGAIDVTFSDNTNKELNMGTEHDYFGPEARTSFIWLPDTVLKNRLFLRTILQKNNFVSINSEWWHFEHINGRKYSNLDIKFKCD